MTLDKLTKIANVAQRWIDRRSAFHQISQYHLKQALRDFWLKRSPQDYRNISVAMADDDDATDFINWCMETLGYMPWLEDKQIVFRSGADETVFYLRWHCVGV